MHEIWFRTHDGREILAFTWTRCAASGILRAMREAPLFGHDAVAFWSRPCKEH